MQEVPDDNDQLPLDDLHMDAEPWGPASDEVNDEQSLGLDMLLEEPGLEVEDEGVVGTGDEGGEEEAMEVDKVSEDEAGPEEGQVDNSGKPSRDPSTFETLPYEAVSPLSVSPGSSLAASTPSPLIGGAPKPLTREALDARILELQYLG